MKENAHARYLLVDVDGTLLTSAGEITPRTQAALARAAEGGWTLVLATGRTYPSLQRSVKEIGLPYHAITNGGAVGFSPGMKEVLFSEFLAGDIWPGIVERLQRVGLSTVVFSHRHPESPLFYVASMAGDPHFQSYLGRHRENCRVVNTLAAAEISQVVEVAALGKGEGFDRASQTVLGSLNGEVRGHSMVLYLNARYGKITEFFSAGTSKWQAFAGMFPEAADHPERVVAIGDEANDTDMLLAAGLGIAMGNATPEVKALADRVTLDNDHEGLAEALEGLL